jgi:predicted anti-sigma-YlaC factor YlaD
MDCKTAEKTIPYFLQDELDGTELAEFVKHIEECPECREELTIQFLVAEGIGQLEKGDNFNLQKALIAKMESAKQKIRFRRTLWYTLLCLEAAVVAEIIVALCVVFRL